MKQGLFRLTASILYLVSLLPFQLLYLISDVLFFFLYIVFRYRRKVVKMNLLNSFPELSEKSRNDIERKYYRYLADLIMESIKSFSITARELKKRYKFQNLEEITQHLDAGKNVIAVSGHYGNWEWANLRAALEIKGRILVVYKPLSDISLDKLFRSMRSKFGSILVPMKQTLRKITEYKNMPHVLVLVGDQTPTREESQYFTDFLNQPTAVFLGIEKVALNTNNPIVYFNINRIKRGYYECTVKALINNPAETSDHEITKVHTRELENHIRLNPEFWLWSHRRWKFSPEDIKHKL